MKSTMYIVMYSGGSYDDYFTDTIFVTEDKDKATEYVKRYNDLLAKWKEYYKKFEENPDSSWSWIKDEFVEEYFDRWNSLTSINECYLEEIEVR